MFKDNAERRVKKAKLDIIRSQLPGLRMFAGVLMVGTTEVIDDFPTAYTDGVNEKYGRGFVNVLKPKELAFVVLHENLHKACRHIRTWKKLFKEDPRCANMAMDHVINLMAVEADPNGTVITMPVWSDAARKQAGVSVTPDTADGKPMGCLDKRFAGMHVKQVYDILRQEQKQQGGSGGSGNGSGNAGFDEHDWAKGGDISKEEAEKIEAEIDRALRQGAMEAKKLIGKGGGTLNLAIDQLLEPEVDWKQVLREFVTQVCATKDQSSWRRPNRRFIGSDMLMPSLYGETVGRIVVGIDTSGSIGQQELTKFMSEVVAVANAVNPSGIDLVYWDSQVAGHEEYDPSTYASMAQTTKPKGGGGTDPTCMLPFLKEKKIKPECILMLTDGYVPSWGSDWPAPVLWVISNNKGATPSCGTAVHIND